MRVSDPIAEFQNEKKINIEVMSHDKKLKKLSRDIMAEFTKLKYPYNFGWMGRPIIQLPQDILAMQEIIWNVKPDLIVEAGIAHGGSIIFYASMLELLGGKGQVVGVDVDIREHNRSEIEKHPMFKRITLLEGSSVDPNIVGQVRKLAVGKKSVLVVLDSNHTHEHVRKELEHYSPLVTKGSYIVVFDTIIDDLPKLVGDRPWGKGNNPKTAVKEFLKSNRRFEIDEEIAGKLILTAAREGYLKCVRD